MNRRQFIRKIKKRGKATGTAVDWQPERGKGSHGTLYYGFRFSVLADRDFPPLLVRKVCEQLGIDPDEL